MTILILRQFRSFLKSVTTKKNIFKKNDEIIRRLSKIFETSLIKNIYIFKKKWTR